MHRPRQAMGLSRLQLKSFDETSQRWKPLEAMADSMLLASACHVFMIFIFVLIAGIFKVALRIFILSSQVHPDAAQLNAVSASIRVLSYNVWFCRLEPFSFGAFYLV